MLETIGGMRMMSNVSSSLQQRFRTSTNGETPDAHTSTLDGIEAWVGLTRDAVHRRDFHDQAEEEDDCVHPVESSAGR